MNDRSRPEHGQSLATSLILEARLAANWNYRLLARSRNNRGYVCRDLHRTELFSWRGGGTFRASAIGGTHLGWPFSGRNARWPFGGLRRVPKAKPGSCAQKSFGKPRRRVALDATQPQQRPERFNESGVRQNSARASSMGDSHCRVGDQSASPIPLSHSPFRVIPLRPTAYPNQRPLPYDK